MASVHGRISLGAFSSGTSFARLAMVIDRPFRRSRISTTTITSEAAAWCGVGTSELGLYNTDYITIIIILLFMYCIILYSLGLGLNLYLTVAASLVAVPSSQQRRESTKVRCLHHHHHRESILYSSLFSFFLFGWSWWKYHQPHRDLTDVSIPSITDEEEEERRRFLFSQSTHVEHEDVSESQSWCWT